MRFPLSFRKKTCANGGYVSHRVIATPGIRFRATLVACKIHSEIRQCRSVHVFCVSRRVIVHFAVRKPLFHRARKRRDGETARYKRTLGSGSSWRRRGALLSNASRGMITRSKARVKPVVRMLKRKKWTTLEWRILGFKVRSSADVLKIRWQAVRSCAFRIFQDDLFKLTCLIVQWKRYDSRKLECHKNHKNS